VLELVGEVSKRSAEIETARRLPDDLVARIGEAGCFRMLVPASHGGDDMPLPEALRVIETLARADGATGWTISVLAAAPVILGFLPAATYDEIYANGPDLISAGVFAPKGTAVRKGDGWRVTGRWPFVTGCHHASQIFVHCVVYGDDGSPQLVDGAPVMRMAVLPAAEVKILDTWETMGLRGSGSDDVRVRNAFCPDRYTFRLLGGTPSVEGAAFNISPYDQLGLFIAPVLLGIAQGALDEVTELAASGKRPAFSPRRMAESPDFQERLGEAYLILLAARALLYDHVNTTWAKSEADIPAESLDYATRLAICARVATMTTTVVDTAYNLAGGSALYSASPLQRRLRDIHTATQHIAARRGSYKNVGALLLGEEAGSFPA
jgi:alkylation response protein AidB-like acyl-CoA dehydrogenase